jgi:hypothetical protein
VYSYPLRFPRAARVPCRNGGHLNPPLYRDYVQLKLAFGVESAKRIIRFRRAHLSALREAVEEGGALNHSQIRDVEKLDVYFDDDTFKEEVEALEVWRKDMPEEAADSRVIEGSEAAKVTIRFLLLYSTVPMGHRLRTRTDIPTL